MAQLPLPELAGYRRPWQSDWLRRRLAREGILVLCDAVFSSLIPCDIGFFQGNPPCSSLS